MVSVFLDSRPWPVRVTLIAYSRVRRLSTTVRFYLYSYVSYSGTRVQRADSFRVVRKLSILSRRTFEILTRGDGPGRLGTISAIILHGPGVTTRGSVGRPIRSYEMSTGVGSLITVRYDRKWIFTRRRYYGIIDGTIARRRFVLLLLPDHIGRERRRARAPIHRRRFGINSGGRRTRRILTIKGSSVLLRA